MPLGVQNNSWKIQTNLVVASKVGQSEIQKNMSNESELTPEIFDTHKKLDLLPTINESDNRVLLQLKESDNIELPPPSGHTDTNVEIISETDTHFNPVVKHEIKEAVRNQSTHYLFSVGGV